MALRSRTRIVFSLLSVVVLMTASTRSTLAVPDIMYETFGQNGVSGFNLATGSGVGNLGVPATNIVAGGGMVYFQSGNTIYSTTTNLVGLNTVITNGQAPTGLALDAADGILYETFGSNGVSAINLVTGRGVGNLFVPATNIVYGNGIVYFESGNTIYSSSANLVGLTTVLTNGQAPIGLALDAADGILYETFGANGVSGINLSTGRGVGNLGISATNIVYGNGSVYFENGDTIYSSSLNLVGLNTVHTNGEPASGLAFLATPAAVPEPGSIVLAFVGLLGLAGRYLWRVLRTRQGFVGSRVYCASDC